MKGTTGSAQHGSSDPHANMGHACHHSPQQQQDPELRHSPQKQLGPGHYDDPVCSIGPSYQHAPICSMGSQVSIWSHVSGQMPDIHRPLVTIKAMYTTPNPDHYRYMGPDMALARQQLVSGCVHDSRWQHRPPKSAWFLGIAKS